MCGTAGGAGGATDVNEVPQWLLRGGADDRILADFALIAEACDADGASKYGSRTVIEPLARYLVGRGGGAHRDTPLYELCHLIRAVHAAGQGPDRVWLFFLGQDRLSAASCRTAFRAALDNGGWTRPGFSADEEGIATDYAEGGFTIRYGRMPFLVAIYEFLLGMEEFGFAEELTRIGGDLVAGPPDDATLRAATGALTRRIRQYRRDHLSYARHQASFDLILDFTRNGTIAGFDDETILAFWQVHNLGDFRLYATAFDAFVTFARVMAANDTGAATRAAEPLGGDFGEGEFEVADTGQTAFDDDDWQSPMPLLDQEPASRIRFFLRASERRRLDGLMQYGPYARRLPLAFLRREVFGAVQSAITTDLQVRRGRSELADRLDCSEVESYDDWRGHMTALADHVRKLQLASLHALLSESDGLPEELPGELDHEARHELLAECARTFRRMTRQGFEQTALNDTAHREGFRIGAEVLRQAAAQLDGLDTVLRRLDGAGDRLDNRFAQDRTRFAAEFWKLYGEGHGTL